MALKFALFENHLTSGLDCYKVAYFLKNLKHLIMKQLLWLFILTMLTPFVQAQQMVPVWINSLGGPEWDMANAMTVTPKGEVVIAGTFSDSIRIGKATYYSKGLTDVFSAKYSGSGELIGAFTFGGSQSDFAQLAAYDDYLVLVTKFYSPFELQGRKIDSTGVVNYLVGWFADDGSLIHTQTISSPGELTISSLETNHKGTVYLTGWYTQGLLVGGEKFTAEEGENAFMVSVKKNGKEKAVQKLAKPKTSRYYSSVLGEGNKLYVAGITSSIADSIAGMNSVSYNNLFVTSFDNGEKRNAENILLKGIELVPVSIKEAGEKLWIAAKFKYYCLNGADTLFAKGQSDIVMVTLSTKTNEKSVWTVGGGADDLPLDLSVSGKQVMLTGSYSDILKAGSEKLRGNELGSDLFLVSYEAESQKQLTALSIGGVHNDFPCAAITSEAGVYLLGQFKETIKAGGNTIKTRGSYDVFVARYENCGAKEAIKIEAKAQTDKKGETTYQLAAAEGYTSYKWDNNLGFARNVDAKFGNSYMVEAVDKYGCTCYGQISLSTTKSATIPGEKPLTNEGQLATFKLYPTITNGQVHWQAGEGFPIDGAKLKVYSASGQIVLERNYPGSTGSTSVQSIDLSAQTHGVYLVEISGNGYYKIEKVIVK